MRLQKFIAESGYCSRRRAEELIREGIVTVNGKIAVIGQSVAVGDKVLIDGKPLAGNDRKIYIALNKPKGYTCTNRLFKNEKNIFDLVDIDERLFIVGRLDKDSRGLVVLTNDGEYTQKITHPRYHHEKVYEVTVIPSKSSEQDFSYGSRKSNSHIEDTWARDILLCLKKGILQDGEFLVAKKASYLGDNKFRVTLTEGKKRQLRRMFGFLNLRVKDLVRTQIGNIKLDNLQEGHWQEIKNPQVGDD
jgi:pseudouridine synthase